MTTKNMFTIGIFSLALITAAAFGMDRVYAQGWGGYCGGPGYGQGYGYHHGHMYWDNGYGNIDLMKQELNLTDKQVKELVTIGTEYREKYFENRGDFNKIADLRVEHRKAIEKVLTKKQRDKLDRINNTYGRYGWYGGCPYHY